MRQISAERGFAVAHEPAGHGEAHTAPHPLADNRVDLFRHETSRARIQHFVQSVEEHEGFSAFQLTFEQRTEAGKTAATVVVQCEKIHQGKAGGGPAHVVESRQWNENGQAVGFGRNNAEVFPRCGRSFGVYERQQVQQRGFAAAGISQDNERAPVRYMKTLGNGAPLGKLDVPTFAAQGVHLPHQLPSGFRVLVFRIQKQAAFFGAEGIRGFRHFRYGAQFHIYVFKPQVDRTSRAHHPLESQ